MEIVGSYDLVVVGGGPAGSAAAATAAHLGASVLLLERGCFPRQKVCGEFVSPEALEVLSTLLGCQNAADLFPQAPRLRAARLHAPSWSSEVPLRPPGVSISRGVLDDVLWCAAGRRGALCRQQVVVRSVERDGSRFIVKTSGGILLASRVVNASGRWSELNRKFSAQHPRWLGIKAHVAGPTPEPCVDVYFFNHGYCGVQPVADGVLNVCALVQAGKVHDLQDVIRCDKRLQGQSCDWTAVSEVCTTFPVIFRPVTPVSDGVLNVGDAAAFMDPFAGDGISMALHTGALAGKIAVLGADLETAVRHYASAYFARFTSAHKMAAMARAALGSRLRGLAVAAMDVPLFSKFVLAGTRAKAPL